MSPPRLTALVSDKNTVSLAFCVKPEFVLMNIKQVFWSIENLQVALQWVLQFRAGMTSTHRALG